ncbi:MAG: restriction endonuclease [Clostridia bacterium]|nr:restriction endonuclease [Clostridia bacterium]
MLTPFEQKSRLGSVLDRLATRLLVLALCFLWFYRLWGMAAPALLAGGALCLLLWRTLALWQKRALAHKEATLRAHIGGTLALEGLLTLQPVEAARQAADWLASRYDLDVLGDTTDGVLLRYGQEVLHLICLQGHPQQRTDAGAVLCAGRARLAVSQADRADRCVLCATGAFTQEAMDTADSLEPPVRLIDGDTLRKLAGQLSPATDEQLVAMGRQQRKPFAWASLRQTIFSPKKTRRYAAYGTGLLAFFILTGQVHYLVPSGLCWGLAMLSQRGRYKRQRL